MNIELLISFIVATSLLALTPGPDNIFVMTQSIVNGRKFGLATVFGLMSGCIIHTTLVAFGVSTILKENQSLFFAIKVFGALKNISIRMISYGGSRHNVSLLVNTSDKKEALNSLNDNLFDHV